MSRRLLQEMFSTMVIRKDASLIPHYYHPDFVLETNGGKQRYAAFLQGHETVYATDISYAVRYDEETWVEQADRIAVRVWITTQKPGDDAVEIEVMLIARYVDGKIHRLWELTWPDWTALRALEAYSQPPITVAGSHK